MYCQMKSVKSICHSLLETQSSSPRVIQYCVVVCRDIQVQEKLFKILTCQSYNSKVNSFLCCSSIFVVPKMLSKVAIQKLIQPYPAGSYPISCCHGTMCNSIFLIANIKHLQFPDYSFCCGCICRNN